jgi:hypothetical protein
VLHNRALEVVSKNYPRIVREKSRNLRVLTNYQLPVLASGAPAIAPASVATTHAPAAEPEGATRLTVAAGLSLVVSASTGALTGYGGAVPDDSESVPVSHHRNYSDSDSEAEAEAASAGPSDASADGWLTSSVHALLPTFDSGTRG